MIEAWAEITCHVPKPAVDLLAEYLCELSGQGVCTENRDVDTFSVDGLDDEGFAEVKAYFPAFENFGTQLELVREKLIELATDDLSWEPTPPVVAFIRQEEWSEKWKENYKPFRVGKRLVVKPTWEDFVASIDDLVLEIDPGMAFGTGSHATTKLCLEAIEGICRRTGEFTAVGDFTPISCLDVGTGSGILGIGAVRLGIPSVMGIDIDTEAILAAAANVEQNGVFGQMAVSAVPLAEVSGTFDLVLANILAEELVLMAPLLVARTTIGGFLILSGILIEKEPLVTSGFAPFGLEPFPATRDGEWSCLVYRRLP